ncbi:MAG: hypothetical protein GX130_02700 [Candidatus Hydrogenedens sp.]|nr:hypothetical protein [Candidatus Hydrogenedens sp.]
MNQDVFAPPEYKEGIDADAVCGQCNTVNPEGTLLCKVCGNNLRDQRSLRLAADQMLEGDAQQAPQTTFLYKLLPILGLLIVLWLGINGSRIIESLTTNETTDYTLAGALAESLWNGVHKDRFENLASGSMLSPGIQSQAEQARQTVSPMTHIRNGRYAIFMHVGTEARFAGVANIEADNNAIYYAATMQDGTEFRGSASYLEGTYFSRWDDAGMMSDGLFYAMAGTAQVQPDGSVSVSGQSDMNTLQYNCSAYLLKE